MLKIPVFLMPFQTFVYTSITYFIVKTKRNDIPEMYPTINIEAVKDLHVLNL